MALATIIPSGDGAALGTTISFAGAATKWQALLTDDGVTSYVSYIWNTGAYCYSLVTFTSPTLGAATAINSVRPYTVARYYSTLTPTRAVINLPATGVWVGADQNMTTAFVAYSEVRTTRPVTGAAWQVPDMATMQFGFAAGTGSGTIEQRHTQYYAIVDYTPAPGFWACLVSSLIGPVVGVGMAHAAGMARVLREKALTWPTPSEYAEFMREIRDGRYARHFILGRA